MTNPLLFRRLVHEDIPTALHAAPVSYRRLSCMFNAILSFSAKVNTFTNFCNTELAPRPHYIIARVVTSSIWKHRPSNNVNNLLACVLFGKPPGQRSDQELPVPGRLSFSGWRSKHVLPWQGYHPPVDQRFEDRRLTGAIFISNRAR